MAGPLSLAWESARMGEGAALGARSGYVVHFLFGQRREGMLEPGGAWWHWHRRRSADS